MAFDYRTPFPASVPANIPEFRRTFQHENWTDGESVVQAESNGIEEGFNSRLHKIEADLDALSTDTGRAFAALAEMRASLREILDELRIEVQRLDQSEDWQPANFILGNVWIESQNPTYSRLGYSRDRSGVVHLRGAITRRGRFVPVPGAPQDEVYLFRLPENYRPPYFSMFRATISGGSVPTPLVNIFIYVDGLVSVTAWEENSVNTLFLDGICFRPS